MTSTSSARNDRLLKAVGERTYRKIASLSKTHPKTVRRYMQGQTPSVEFLASLARGLGLNGSWLLTGDGPVRQSEVRGDALRDADVSELLTAMADTIENVDSRLQRLETFVQTLESRLFAQNATPKVPRARPLAVDHDNQRSPGPPSAGTHDDCDRPDITIRPEAADRIGRATSKRPSGAGDADA